MMPIFIVEICSSASHHQQHFGCFSAVTTYIFVYIEIHFVDALVSALKVILRCLQRCSRVFQWLFIDASYLLGARHSGCWLWCKRLSKTNSSAQQHSPHSGMITFSERCV